MQSKLNQSGANSWVYAQESMNDFYSLQGKYNHLYMFLPPAQCMGRIIFNIRLVKRVLIDAELGATFM